MNRKIDTSKVIEALKLKDKFFKDVEQENAWVSFKTNGNYKTRTIASDDYHQRVQVFIEEEFGHYPSRGCVEQICYALTAFTKDKGPKKKIHLRIARKSNNIYYDLGNEKGDLIKMSPDGVKFMLKKDKPFRNPPKQKAQVLPIKDTSKKISLESILEFVNISDEYKTLFIIYLITCFIPEIEHPMLVLCGGAGQGKTTISSIVKGLVDPGHAELSSLSSLKDENFYLSLHNSWLSVFENESNLRKSDSDNLCRAITGSAFERRKHFSNDEMFYIHIKRCIVVNCIKNILREEDIIDRSLIFTVKQKKGDNFKLPSDLMEEFRSIKPFLLYEVFETISKALSLYPSIEYVPKTRMAEFEKWGYTIAKAIGKEKIFLQQYEKMIRTKLDETIRNNTLLIAIEHLLHQMPDKCWSGRILDLLRELEQIAISQKLDVRDSSMPRSPEQLSKMLTAYEHLLKANKIKLIRKKRTNRGANVSLEMIE